MTKSHIPKKRKFKMRGNNINTHAFQLRNVDHPLPQIFVNVFAPPSAVGFARYLSEPESEPEPEPVKKLTRNQRRRLRNKKLKQK